ncbi:hypothetical protein [Nocardia carnea]|uniref:hypothetical protein n=1 Tax=Nocardia carnea TaxID=37328 RepID=UPI002453F3A2|nr:hypothetical protein [Nocardia carnea]
MSSIATRYFHRGAPGLAVGDFIVPRSELPLDGFDRHATSLADPADVTLTYFTENLKVARGFAIKYANSPTPRARDGWLYEVRPIPVEEIAPDPDFPARARCWTAPRCEVTAVVQQSVPGGPRAVTRALGPFTEWTDGRRAYTRDGYMTPSPELRECGVTAAHLHALGQWISVEDVFFNRLTRQVSLVSQGAEGAY